MRYILLIYSDEEAEARLTEAEQETLMGRYYAFTEEVRNRGVYQTGDALQPTVTATTVRVRQGQTLATDGPYTETKEQLGGFYVLDCRDLDEAIELAAKIPSAEGGAIEIRPIMEFD
jgi:hypothetical protein